MGLSDRTPPTVDEYLAYPERFSNWGRWGDDDELGTLNHITDDVRRAAAALATEGRVVSLSRSVDTFAGPANPYPAHHFVAMEGSGGMLDWFGMFIHGVTQTHIDALSHLGAHQHEGGVYWNNQPFGPLRMPSARSGTIEHWRDGIVTRGVLYDIPRLRGTEWVEPGAPVHGWELADAAAARRRRATRRRRGRHPVRARRVRGGPPRRRPVRLARGRARVVRRVPRRHRGVGAGLGLAGRADRPAGPAQSAPDRPPAARAQRRAPLPRHADRRQRRPRADRAARAASSGAGSSCSRSRHS